LPSRLKKFLLRGSLLALGLISSLVIAEIVVRVFYPHTMDSVIPGELAVMDERLGWKLRPMAQTQHETRYFKVDYAISPLGIRDNKTESAKPRGTRRYLLYGDSQIFGWGVNIEERFSNLIEKELPNVEIWNCGVYAYGLDQEYLFYRDTTFGAEADNVVLWVSEVTLERMSLGSKGGKQKPRLRVSPDGKLTSYGISLSRAKATKTLYSLIRTFYLPHFVLAMIEGATHTDVPCEPSGLSELAKAVLSQAQRLSRERGQTLSVLSALDGPRLDELRQFCGENEIELMTIKVGTSATEIFGNDDPHWTPASHASIASQLLPQFQKSLSRSSR